MAFGDNFAKLCRLPSAGISADVFSQSVFSFRFLKQHPVIIHNKTKQPAVK